MSAAFFQRLEAGARAALPVTLGFLFLFLQHAPWPIAEGGPITPPLALMALYTWAVHRPDLFSARAAFALGLLADLLAQTPFGLWTLLFLVTHNLLLRQRHLFQSFFMLWWGFAVTALMNAFLAAFALWAFASVLIAPIPLLLSVGIGIALYPLIGGLLMQLQRRWLQAE